MKTILNNKILVLLSAFLFFGVAYFFHHSFSSTSTFTINSFESTLHLKEKRLNEEMSSLAKQASTKNYNQLFIEQPAYYNDLMEREGLALLIYENDTLKFWSDNSIAVENWVKEVCLDTKMAKLHNGWFEVMRPHTNATTTKTIVGLILLKNVYPYQNKYLINEFQKDFDISADTKLIIDHPESTTKIKNSDGEYLFSLVFNPSSYTTSTSYVSVLLNILACILILIFFRRVFASTEKRIGKHISVLLFVVSIVSLRLITIIFSLPESFYGFELFSPKVFADANSIWLTSLGDLLINVVLLFYLSFYVLNELSFKSILILLNNRKKLILSFVLFLSFFCFSWLITELFTGLINNSNIPFSINNLFSLNSYSYVGIVIIGLLLFVYFLFADKIVDVLKLLDLDIKAYVIVFVITGIIYASVSQLLGSFDLLVFFLPFILIFSINIFKRSQTAYSFSGIVFLVFIFSLYAVHVFIKHSGIKEKETRKIYAEKLAAEQDPVAELLFQDVEEKIQNDAVLISYINRIDKQPAEFEKRIRQQYFSGFWEKYDLHVALFDSMCLPVIKARNPMFDNNFYFDDLIAKKGKPTSCENFNFINNASGKISYLAKLDFFRTLSTKRKFGTLYIELDAKFISDEIGFPELLLDKNVGLSEELTNYSYAKYKHHQLINQYGKFSYGLTSKDLEGGKDEFQFMDKDGYNHLLFQPNPETLIVLSKRSEGFIGQVTTFSYLFAFFSLLLLSVLFFRQVSLGTLFENFTFKYRIQAVLVLIVLVSLALFGGGTIYYINQQFETQNQESISEKIHSVLIDVESKLSNETNLNKSLVDYVSFVLKKSSTVFFTDISFYDAKGNLYASSRSQVFDEGLTSKKMDPEAFLQIAVLGKTEYVHEERIGKLNYLSAYIPFKNKDGKLLAYLNLPYFSKQSKLEKEISGFLVTLINIYVLLFALSIVIAIFISNYVTKPLKLIQDKLSKIKLGKTNEPIEWKEKDEIGNLVSEYNRMIAELAYSADLLARSERESAWREMAKQVAHEIKNPLTPMKLSVQHLQRTWNDHAPDMNEKMERLTKIIIEQIDTLSTIATEFSNFAKMPKTNLEKINVKDVLMNCIGLYSGMQHVHFNFECKYDDINYVNADKEQLLRVFNNLFKNAIQAIPEHQEGKINVLLKKENGQIIISIEDNGTGVNDDLTDKIFSPNFTTKTGGMGLGLAIVRSILEDINGKIWFTTKKGEGSVFYISLPIC